MNESHPLLIECKAKVKQFFKDFDEAEFNEKIQRVIEFVEANIESVENAKSELGEGSEEFRYYSDSIYMMASAKFSEVIKLCQGDETKRKQLFVPLSDQSYGATMWDQYTYILVKSSPQELEGPENRWPLNRDAYLTWTMPILEFGQFKSRPASSKSEGCYIATMAYGDYDHPQVLKLRSFRDEVLSTTFYGRGFIRFYYFISPKLVVLLKDFKTVNRLTRKSLDVFIKMIKR